VVNARLKRIKDKNALVRDARIHGAWVIEEMKLGTSERGGGIKGEV